MSRPSFDVKLQEVLVAEPEVPLYGIRVFDESDFSLKLGGTMVLLSY